MHVFLCVRYIPYSIAAYLYICTSMYLSLRYTIVNSENYRNYSKCQFKRRIITFPPFHASNRFEGKTNFAAFVGCTHDSRRDASVRHSELRPPLFLGPPLCGLLFGGDCVAQKCSKRCRLHSMRADANVNRPKLDRFESI